MRRTLTIGLGTIAALAASAVALAVVPGAVGISTAKATFATTTVEKSKVRSCTADAKTWETTDARYTGTVVSDNALLAGSLLIHAKTRYNTTDKLGYVDGSFQVNKADGRVKGRFAGTINDGKLVGFLTGNVRGNHARVYGNLSATFAGGTSNFTDGSIGSDSSTAVLAIVAGPVCKTPRPEKEKKSEKSEKSEKPMRHVEVKGEITVVGGDPLAITVNGRRGPLTCKVDANYAIPAGFPVGTKDVEMKCEAVGDPAVWTLRKLEKHS